MGFFHLIESVYKFLFYFIFFGPSFLFRTDLVFFFFVWRERTRKRVGRRERERELEEERKRQKERERLIMGERECNDVNAYLFC